MMEKGRVRLDDLARLCSVFRHGLVKGNVFGLGSWVLYDLFTRQCVFGDDEECMNSAVLYFTRE
jgi:hypothetical protein